MGAVRKVTFPKVPGKVVALSQWGPPSAFDSVSVRASSRHVPMTLAPRYSLSGSAPLVTPSLLIDAVFRDRDARVRGHPISPRNVISA